MKQKDNVGHFLGSFAQLDILLVLLSLLQGQKIQPYIYKTKFTLNYFRMPASLPHPFRSVHLSLSTRKLRKMMFKLGFPHAYSHCIFTNANEKMVIFLSISFPQGPLLHGCWWKVGTQRHRLSVSDDIWNAEYIIPDLWGLRSSPIFNLLIMAGGGLRRLFSHVFMYV